MEQKAIINLFIRFLKEKGVYKEYRKARKNVDEFLHITSYYSFVIEAFCWSDYGNVDWCEIHNQWNQILIEYQKHDLERAIR